MNNPTEVRARHHVPLALAALTSPAAASFADEITTAGFSLTLAGSGSTVLVSIVLSCGLLGGVAAGGVGSALLRRHSPWRVVLGCVIGRAALLAVVGARQREWTFVPVALLLGAVGAIYWSAVLSVVARNFNGTQLDRATTAVNTVRNVGFVAGPAPAGAAFEQAGLRGLLLTTAVVLLVLGMTLRVSVRSGALGSASRLGADGGDEDNGASATRQGVLSFVRQRWIMRDIGPFCVTIAASSTMSITLVFYITQVLDLGASVYGLVVATLCVGLLAGPWLAVPWLTRLGRLRGGLVAAAGIGPGMVALGLTGSLPAMLAAVAVIGIFNGSQNALVGAHVMATLGDHGATADIARYVSLVQACVLVGFLIGGAIPASSAGMAIVIAGAVTGAAALFAPVRSVLYPETEMSEVVATPL
ncbi:MFS transporter [Janibacter limosus]|uniref:MFS transporter n=1 Tax=Janibacter limosus TaxID=53458 RepID=A0AC61U409_9MICO|nr:MFS transporter [Janibacter limosus]UUZ44729.1 MFS transporter [Janibacter limosus]